MLRSGENALEQPTFGDPCDPRGLSVQALRRPLAGWWRPAARPKAFCADWLIQPRARIVAASSAALRWLQDMNFMRPGDAGPGRIDGFGGAATGLATDLSAIILASDFSKIYGLDGIHRPEMEYRPMRMRRRRFYIPLAGAPLRRDAQDWGLRGR